MKKEEAKQQILSEWRSWWATNGDEGQQASGNEGFAFFGYLESEKPYLLDFRSPGDRWQTVHSWLLRARYVSD